MKRTLVLYEYPVAFSDVKAWHQRMEDQERLIEASYKDPIRPIFTLTNDETLECHPLQDLKEDPVHLLEPLPIKLVMIGAVTGETRRPLIQFLTRLDEIESKGRI